MAQSVLTVKEIAKYLKIHESTVYRLVKRSQLPAFRVGSDLRFDLETIDRWRLRSDGSSTRRE
jgi:excisionase family DNA binding protein